MKTFNEFRSKFSQKKKSNIFLFILSFFITLFISISLNSAGIQSTYNNLYYADYPTEYSAYNFLQENTYEDFMKNNFPDFDYEFFYTNNRDIYTNIVSSELEVQVIGCEANFENFPLPSTYSDSIVSTSISEGSSFSNLDILTKTNGMIMYGSQLEKIGYQQNDKININGQDFVLQGVLKDNSDIKRNIDENKIQIFIPYTTYSTLLDNPVVKTVIHTEKYTFKNFDNNNNFISYYKVLNHLDASESYIESASYSAILSTFAISFIATAIVQIILIKGRYNEIGIRRAIGASRDAIIYQFTKKSIFDMIFGALIGFVTFIILLLSAELVLSNIFYTNFFIFNFNSTGLFLVIYIFFSYLSVLIPSIIGTRINISTILVEEK